MQNPTRRVLGETVLTLKEARKEFPTHPALSTVRRWCRAGVRLWAGSRGEVLALEWARSGRYIVTSRQAIERFKDRMNP